MGDPFNNYLEEEAAKRRLEAEAQDADPVYQARVAAKRKEEHARGVRLGWWTEDGEPIPQVEDTEEDDEE